MTFRLNHRGIFLGPRPRTLMASRSKDDLFSLFFSSSTLCRKILSLLSAYEFYFPYNPTSSPGRTITATLSFSKSWCTHYLIFLKGWAVKGWVTKLHKRKEHSVKKTEANVHRFTLSNNSHSNTTIIFTFGDKKLDSAEVPKRHKLFLAVSLERFGINISGTSLRYKWFCTRAIVTFKNYSHWIHMFLATQLALPVNLTANLLSGSQTAQNKLFHWIWARQKSFQKTKLLFLTIRETSHQWDAKAIWSVHIC